MSTENKEVKDGLERWLDERIRIAIGRLPNPFEKRIDELRERIKMAQERLGLLSSTEETRQEKE